MGKGDIKSRRGKIAKKSFGVRRPKKPRNVATMQHADKAIEEKKKTKKK